jgi:DNA mismatch repair ATPase MutS
MSKTQFEFLKQSASNNFIYDTQIDEICKMITSAKVEMKDIITQVFYTFIEHFETFQEKMESIIQFITFSDIIYTKASLAKKYNYCRPTIVEADKSFVNAKGLRHSLIEHLQTNEIYVANDIYLGTNNVDGILLYGTNAVGKTSFIKSIGISLIMAQSGLFVPCSNLVYKPYKYIFTRIIGNDNIFKGLSTFAVEMSELRTIFRLADENSLILGDELCSGTENTSAISLLKEFPEKIDWFYLSQNPSAINLLKANPDNINWYGLSRNPNPKAIKILRNNQEKIHWYWLSANPSIFINLESTAITIQRAFRKSKKYIQWYYHPDRLLKQGYFNDI